MLAGRENELTGGMPLCADKASVETSSQQTVVQTGEVDLISAHGGGVTEHHSLIAWKQAADFQAHAFWGKASEALRECRSGAGLAAQVARARG